jgi:very-short-patch-repair endonuclease
MGNIHYPEECSDAKRTYLLQRGGTVEVFRNKKSFIALFPDEVQKEIRKMLNRNQFQLHNASPGEITRMMVETANLISKGGS